MHLEIYFPCEILLYLVTLLVQADGFVQLRVHLPKPSYKKVKLEEYCGPHNKLSVQSTSNGTRNYLLLTCHNQF